MRQLLEGIRYLHEEKSVCHRDVKPDNIIVSEKVRVDGGKSYRLKLCDFNVAKNFNHKTMMTKTGLEEWSAPEMVGGAQYTCKIDLWSVGCVLYFMLTGEKPFSSQNLARLYHQ